MLEDSGCLVAEDFEDVAFVDFFVEVFALCAPDFLAGALVTAEVFEVLDLLDAVLAAVVLPFTFTFFEAFASDTSDLVAGSSGDLRFFVAGWFTAAGGSDLFLTVVFGTLPLVEEVLLEGRGSATLEALLDFLGGMVAEP